MIFGDQRTTAKIVFRKSSVLLRQPEDPLFTEHDDVAPDCSGQANLLLLRSPDDFRATRFEVDHQSPKNLRGYPCRHGARTACTNRAYGGRDILVDKFPTSMPVEWG
jgi:hypothetical protein